MKKIIKILLYSAATLALLGLGSYINFYTETTRAHFLRCLLFPIPLALVLAVITYSISKKIKKINDLFQPEEQRKNDITGYEKIRDDLRTGDVVAFSSKNWLTKIGTNSRYTHVGLVLQIEFPSDSGKKRVFFVESDDKKGVVLVRLSSKLETYDGEAWLYKLTSKTDVENCIFEFAMSQLGKNYDFLAIKNIVENILGTAVMDAVSPQDDNAFICSELVGRIFQEAGLIERVKTASLFSPRDVTEFGCLTETAKLI